MLEDLYENKSFEDRSAWRENTRKKVSKTIVEQATEEEEDDD